MTVPLYYHDLLRFLVVYFSARVPRLECETFVRNSGSLRQEVLLYFLLYAPCEVPWPASPVVSAEPHKEGFESTLGWNVRPPENLVVVGIQIAKLFRKNQQPQFMLHGPEEKALFF